ncbi:MAG: hypothetical protein LH702_32790 [Phormidesmis sp. CAN_BIN44]|nr:hypothetical protein [Phormidesmis sp. CAN_BIN44]
MGTCSKQRSGRVVAGCGGYSDTSPVNQQILIVRLEAPATSLCDVAVIVTSANNPKSP